MGCGGKMKKYTDLFVCGCRWDGGMNWVDANSGDGWRDEIGRYE
jgi:hypothetical protein